MSDFNRRLEKNPLVASRVIDGAVLLVPIRQPGPEITKVYRLQDPVAARVWQLIDGQRSVREIHRCLCQTFDAEARTIERDLLKFVKRLESIGAIRVATASRHTRGATQMTVENGGMSVTPQDVDLTDSLRLSIGGIGLSIQWQEPRRVGWPHPFYEPFVGEGNEKISLQIQLDEFPDSAGDELLFDGAHHWKLYRHGSRYIFESFDTVSHSRNIVSLVSENFDRAEVYVSPGSSGTPPPWSIPRLMNPLGQWLLVNRLAEVGGVMVHAVAIDDRGHGRVFMGPSGSGKSTLARFWRRRNGVRILCDEHVILRCREGRLYAYGTPWPGMGFTVSPDMVEVTQLFFIEHAPEHRAWSESQGIFASRLFSQLFLPRWNHRITESALVACQELVQKVECQRLGFAKHPNVIDFVRGVKRGGVQ